MSEQEVSSIQIIGIQISTRIPGSQSIFHAVMGSEIAPLGYKSCLQLNSILDGYHK